MPPPIMKFMSETMHPGPIRQSPFANAGYNGAVDYRDLDDATLLRHMARRQELALEVFYDRYARLVYSVAYAVIRDAGAAEEIALDIFETVWKHAGDYQRERASVRTWMLRMTRNRAIDRLRREDVRPLRSSVSWQDIAPHKSAAALLPEREVQSLLRSERVRAAVQTLPEAQQQALVLAFFRGLTHREIAAELNEPLGTIKTRIRLGMQKLRDLLLEDAG